MGPMVLRTPPVKCYSKNSSPVALPPGSFSSGGGGGGLDYIEHTVSKFDTLVGVAIKYGVEVVDIKRMNGLIADQQMFASKSLKIPLRGKHSPSPIMSNRSTKHVVICDSDTHSDLFDSIKSLKLSAYCQLDNSLCMNNFRIYYGSKPNDGNDISESLEMSVYRKESSYYFENEHKTSQTSNSFVGVHQKTKIVVDAVLETDDMSITSSKNDGFDKYFEKLVRRRNGKITIH
ncbi:uncharacterized protein LOC111886240 [Lactuca sativa]|uniref:LysM domain-containing protein n=1 Tax=Lactuca sativa TaxID=4236 RepID=A0A9R1XMJ5_LACSA|nr:uncharacterized protein LOC111886240 [Lactuca sativa]KAJ0212942.1 hypothetical protein LSAT_V11C400182560 [Lactuca sativa]